MAAGDKKSDVLDDAPIAVPVDDAPIEVEEPELPPAPAASEQQSVGRGRGAWKEPPGYINHIEAMKMWCEMGKGRTLKRLLEEMKKLNRPCPARATLKTWSAKHDWKEKAKVYDTEVAIQADDLIKAKKAIDGAKQMMSLAGDMRGTARKLLKRLNLRIDQIKIKSGGEAKAMAEAAVSLNRAAEVLDGGVGDRTEHRETLTLEERQSAATAIVDDVMKQLRTKKGNDNSIDAGDELGDGADARRGAG